MLRIGEIVARHLQPVMLFKDLEIGHRHAGRHRERDGFAVVAARLGGVERRLPGFAVLAPKIEYVARRQLRRVLTIGDRRLAIGQQLALATRRGAVRPAHEPMPFFFASSAIRGVIAIAAAMSSLPAWARAI